MSERARRTVIAAGFTVALSAVAAVPASATTKAQLKSEALSISDMPAGWSVDNAAAGGADQGCLSSLAHQSREQKVSVAFKDGDLPEVEEALTTGPGSPPAYTKLVKTLNNCKSYTATSGGTTTTIQVGILSFPKVGQQSHAYSLSLSVDGINAAGDLVLFRSGSVAGAVAYFDLGSPDIGSAEHWVKKALAKVTGAA